jgi:hypothetical protein
MFVANARSGDAFIGPDGKTYELTNIATESAISIYPPYLGATASGQIYAIAPMQGYVKASADRLREASDNYGYKLENIGTMAEQNANAVAITGGAINGTTVGATTPSTGKFSSLEVNVPSGQASLFLSQAGVNNGRIYAGGGAGTDVVLESNRFTSINGSQGVVIRAGAPLVDAVFFAANGNSGFGVSTPDASARIQSQNGIKLGNTANSDPNVLDFYLESSGATPYVAGSSTAGTATYTTRRSTFTRNGNRVDGEMVIAFSGHTGTGSMRVGPLPYAANTTAGFSSVAIYANGLIPGAGHQVQAYIADGGAEIIMTRLNVTTGAESGQPMQAGVAFLILTYSYRV